MHCITTVRLFSSFSRIESPCPEVLQSFKMRKNNVLSRKKRSGKRAPGPATLCIGFKDICDLAVDVWRLRGRCRRTYSFIADNDKRSIEDSLERLSVFLEKNGVEIIDYTGQRFNEGLNIEILASEKNVAYANTVKETLEPTVLIGGKLFKKAKVILYD